MSGKELLRILKSLGWRVDRISGSHQHLVRGGKRLIVPVHGKRELAKGLVETILQEAGLK